MPASEPVPTQGAMRRGFFCRCPACGEGRMFRAFLKVADSCPACSEELHHQRADDFPAYCVMFIVGHLIIPLVFLVEVHFAPPTWLHLAIWLPATTGLALALLQPVKGTIVALQWALGMHGFEDGKKQRAAALMATARIPVSPLK